MAEDEESVRVDVWSWAVRLFKTRSLAGSACRKEQLTVNGSRCRPAKKIRCGDIVSARRGTLTKTVEVKAILSKRVGAKLVDDYLIDRTPPEEYERAAEVIRFNRQSSPQRERGSGRPTKRERREMDEILDETGNDDAGFEEFLKSFTRQR